MDIFTQSSMPTAWVLWSSIMDIDHIDKAIVENYRKLRTRIGIMTVAFPFVLIAAGCHYSAVLACLASG